MLLPAVDANADANPALSVSRSHSVVLSQGDFLAYCSTFAHTHTPEWKICAERLWPIRAKILPLQQQQKRKTKTTPATAPPPPPSHVCPGEEVRVGAPAPRRGGDDGRLSRFSPVSLRAEPIATDEEETDQYEREGEEREREREKEN